MSLLELCKDPSNDIIKEQQKDLNSSGEDDVAKWMLREQVKQYYNRLLALQQNKQKLYGILWGQSSSGLQEVIKADEEYADKSSKFDCIWLLEKLNLVSAGVDKKANKYSSLVRAITAFVTMRQGPTKSNDSFQKRVEANAISMELAGGSHIMFSPQIATIADKTSGASKEEKEKNRFKAIIMILRADPGRYASLQESLFKGVYKGRDEFPETPTEAYDLLQRISSDISLYTTGTTRFGRFRFRNRHKVGMVSFMQQGSKGSKHLTPDRDGKVHPEIKCHNCGREGHYANQCDKNKVQFAHFSLTQNKLQIINKHWLLLDSCLTVSVCTNPELV